MPRITATRTALAVLGASLTAFAAPAAAAPSPVLHATEGATPTVLNVPKRLGAPQAKAVQATGKRTGRFPRPPRLATTRGLQQDDGHVHAADERPDHSLRRDTQATRVPVGKHRPASDPRKLFGTTGTFESSRWNLYQWVNYVFGVAVPANGGGFSQPAVYEVAHGGSTPRGCGPITSAMNCGGGGFNDVGWSAPYMQNVFNTHGDAAFAGVIAHEYGHGVMHWSGFAGRGQFRYQLMREGFADCMAGAWVSYMYNSGHTDGIGRGDGNEVVDSLAAVGAASTRWDNHGDARWRSSAATYGWNVGFRGCLAWGRQIAAA